MKKLSAIFILIVWLTFTTSTATACQEKVLICGICKNTENTAPLTIYSIEALGKHFADYAVIIYENNSSDNTAALYQKWAEENNRVYFVSEELRHDQLLGSRTENIARARNVVLSLARDSKYADFKYLIMADLDFFREPWPVTGILEAVEIPVEWDCLCANGVNPDEEFLELYSFRDARYPFGSEMMGDDGWWGKLDAIRFKIREDDRLLPVYSAFGGLAIYKRATIIQFSYSGVVTEDLRQYYQQILLSTSEQHPQIQEYLQIIGMPKNSDLSTVPIIFQGNTIWEHPCSPNLPTCCEHVTLHASMAVNGFGKIFVYPKMRMYY